MRSDQLEIDEGFLLKHFSMSRITIRFLDVLKLIIAVQSELVYFKEHSLIWFQKKVIPQVIQEPLVLYFRTKVLCLLVVDVVALA